ncbi:hypothetical protein [Polyangium sp. y55x31]|uniref:hypothetical protein n=1 Tax=Polyangium sp. y55x31 TaxID=3042688 RepID=UPI0024829911|nr:hypothetical protein [Polyangium sp. y55x31]MDI1477404.1 hypothetical protein [Polyangium sp. y55x31]
MRRGQAAAISLVLASVLAFASIARAATPEELHREGTEALARGAYGTAIERFEALADMGFVHPDASFGRGLAYVARVRAGADRPGDLGRAAAAFEETLRLRPSDIEADHALDLVRAEVVRRRARRGKDATTVRPTLDRAVIGLASERTWSLLALVSSILLSIGLFLRRSRASSFSVAGRIMAPTALVLLCVFLPLTIAARRLRLTTRAGVVVVPEVHLVDDHGTALGGEPIPEAHAVEVGEARGGLVHVRWGATEGWVPSGSVRLLSP